MSAASCLLTEDQFLCSICLDVFTDPVTIPCGHNFCKTCITQHWNINAPYQCPNCKKKFNTRPELHVNTFISEMAAQFRQAAQQKTSSSRSEQHVCKSGEVPCDVCTGPKLKALGKAEIQQMIQKRRLKIQEIKCSVELSKEAADREIVHGVQVLIQKRRLKIQELKCSMELSKEVADREIADGVQVFTALRESVERSQAEFIDTIKEEQRMTEKQAEDFIKELEQEISELKKRSTELEQLSHSEDHLLQSFLSLKAAPPTKDWTGVSVHPPSYEGTVRRAVSQLEETLSKQMKKLFEAELKRVQQYAVDVTLDRDTAHPNLILSDDGKKVKHVDVKKNRPNTRDRFDVCVYVLAKQSFSSGKFYYEVQVKGKTKWDLGVARESINRKGNITLSPRKGYWTIWLRNDSKYEANAGPAVRLSLKSRPEKVGVFVDYEEGVVSFYDVDAPALIYSFTGCSFTERLYPLFCPCFNDGGKNSAPLIISPVNHTE